MTAAVIYTRISKDEARQHLGVDRQERLCRDLADRDGLTILEVLTDNDVSAYGRKKRPGFERLVDMLRSGEAGAVVTYHADRLYRRTTDLERLVPLVEVTGAQVHTVAAGNIDLTAASGRMVARMLGAAAQGESERTGERIKAKHDELAAAGKPPGGRPPFGYSKGYEVNPDEAEAVRYMAQRVLEDGSLLGIASELGAKSHHPGGAALASLQCQGDPHQPGHRRPAGPPPGGGGPWPVAPCPRPGDVGAGASSPR